MSSSSVNGLIGNDSVQDFELAVPNGFFAERPLPGTPLEPLNNGVLDGSQETLVHLGRERVVNQDVGA